MKLASNMPLRREPREQTLRVVEYTRFPRLAPDPHPRLGFTRDLSASGLCLGVDVPEPIGSLLRVTLRELDGRPAPTGVLRVVWCSAEVDGRYWLGLELLASPRDHIRVVRPEKGREAASA